AGIVCALEPHPRFGLLALVGLVAHREVAINRACLTNPKGLSVPHFLAAGVLYRDLEVAPAGLVSAAIAALRIKPVVVPLVVSVCLERVVGLTRCAVAARGQV